MKSIKSKQSSRQRMSDKRIDNLAKKALKDGVEWSPAKGYTYLKDIPLGSKFKTGNVEGILLNINKSAARVLIIKVMFGNDDDKKYYMGKQIIAPHTEVRKL